MTNFLFVLKKIKITLFVVILEYISILVVDLDSILGSEYLDPNKSGLCIKPTQI